ncbi:MAG: phosphotransferase [candidate division Zixibacteria bacterium]|nr:phosphotransferase [candidate division Zixibacteria bacterium]
MKGEIGTSVSDVPAVEALARLYLDWAGRPASSIVSLGADGSARHYFRIAGMETVIGAYNANRRENEAFVALSRHFGTHGLPVPEIYAQHLDTGVYLQTDLGDDTLFSHIRRMRTGEIFPDGLTALYYRVIEWLPEFQIIAARDMDYSVCYPRSRFDAQSMRWDLNYFKYDFLKLAGIPFEEQDLEHDFDRLIAFLEQADAVYFLYRDFQSRNIMWTDAGPYFIDYQGGRQGALAYDIASLLLDARAAIPWDIRETLLDFYMDMVSRHLPLRRDVFRHYYGGYAYLRLLQAMGAYGFRGLHEGKTHFLASIPPAIHNLEGLMTRYRLPVALPELSRIWERMCASETLRGYGASAVPELTVHIRSFAYKNGLPRDTTGHGGGFVFDCRALPNPGRYPEYGMLTGRDETVRAFLSQAEEVKRFVSLVEEMVDRAAEHHRARGFTDLTVAFGCTGGQHRSVYCAERLSTHLSGCEGIRVETEHRELKGTV